MDDYKKEMKRLIERLAGGAENFDFVYDILALTQGLEATKAMHEYLDEHPNLTKKEALEAANAICERWNPELIADVDEVPEAELDEGLIENFIKKCREICHDEQFLTILFYLLTTEEPNDRVNEHIKIILKFIKYEPYVNAERLFRYILALVEIPKGEKYLDEPALEKAEQIDLYDDTELIMELRNRAVNERLENEIYLLCRGRYSAKLMLQYLQDHSGDPAQELAYAKKIYHVFNTYFNEWKGYETADLIQEFIHFYSPFASIDKILEDIGPILDSPDRLKEIINYIYRNQDVTYEEITDLIQMITSVKANVNKMN